jgi:hypothetical protein
MDNFTEFTRKNKEVIQRIETIDDFHNCILSFENKRPQRGFSWIGSKKLPSDSPIIHFTKKENIEGILKTGFRGIGSWYSSLTKTKTGMKEVQSGNFSVAWDCTTKKMDSRYTKNLGSYGRYGLVFTSPEAIKSYNDQDKESQVIFDVRLVNPKFIVYIYVDQNNTKEYVYDIYDLDFNEIKSDVKFKEVIDYFKKTSK